jgi:type III secretion protein J
LLVFVLGLAGCSQQELYGQLSERQANEMVALLRNQGIDADKERTKDGQQFALMVPSAGFARSVELLHAAGYPRDEHDTLGGVFKKDGFVTTQLEERARFMHALAQELSTTIQSIDGVVLARVHLAVPEKRRFTDKPETSAASVFIKHRPGLDLSPQLGSIKALVVNAIEGLPYESVTVVTFAAEPWAGGVGAAAAVAPSGMVGLDVPLMAAAGLGGTALLAGGVLWGWQRRRASSTDALADAEGPAGALAPVAPAEIGSPRRRSHV